MSEPCGSALQRLNRAEQAALQQRLLACCASRRWAAALAAQRPFEDLAALLAAARRAWTAVSDEDRLEAFAAHPLIGDVELLRARFGRAHAEQGQVLAAPDAVIEELAALNRRYLDRHGFIFIVCATGRSAEQMRDLLRARINRATADEMMTAAEQQMQITELRLQEAFG